MGRMCTQTRPLSMFSSEKVLGNGVRTHVNSKGKIPSTGSSEQDRTCDAASHKMSQTRYQLSYSGPHFSCITHTTKKPECDIKSAIFLQIIDNTGIEMYAVSICLTSSYSLVSYITHSQSRHSENIYFDF